MRIAEPGDPFDGPGYVFNDCNVADRATVSTRRHECAESASDILGHVFIAKSLTSGFLGEHRRLGLDRIVP